MLNSIAYVVVFAVLLCLVATCFEQLATSRQQPRRFAWVLAMLCSALLPPVLMLNAGRDPIAVPQAAGIALAQQAATKDVDSTMPVTGTVPALTETSAMPTQSPPAAGAWHIPTPSRTSLLATWAVVSGALLALLSGTGLLLRRRSAAWQHAVIQGQELLVSEDTGPALLGALRPRIVVPRWFMDEPAATQSLILAHEQQHIAACDPLLLRVAMLLAIAAPWNLPLWWQLRRLRLAIELDCDARVMRGGAEAARYGAVLLDVTRRAAAMPIGVIAMSEPVSALEKRIRSLSPARGRHVLVRAIGALSIAMAGIGAAAALEVPPLQQVAQTQGARPAATAAPVAPSTRATPATAATAVTPVTPVRPVTPPTAVAAAPAPARTPQSATQTPAGAGAEPNPASPAATGTPPAGRAMDLRELIAVAGGKFKKRFVVDPRVMGTVALGSLDMESLTYHEFLELLAAHAYAAVPSGDVVRIIPEQNARTVGTPLFRPDNIQGDDAEVVTVLIPVNGDPQNIATTLRVLVSALGLVVAMPDGKSLLVVDRVANVKRIVAVVQAVAKPQ